MAGGQVLTSSIGSVVKEQMAALGATVLDAFTDANGTTLQAHNSKWIKLWGPTDVTIQGNQATSTPDGAFWSNYRYSQSLTGQSTDVFLTIANAGSGNVRYVFIGFIRYTSAPYDGMVLTRGGDPTNGWWLAIQRLEGDGNLLTTVTAIVAPAWTAGERLRFSRRGTTFIGYVNDVPQIETSDPTFTQMQTELAFGTGHETLGGDIRFDDFGIGTSPVIIGSPGTLQGGALVLNGLASTSAQGSIVQSATRAIAGQALLGVQGSIVPHGRSLVTSSQGALTPTPFLACTGESIASGQGIVMPEQGGTVGPLVGLQITSAQGFVIPPGAFALVGAESTSAAGMLTPVIIPTFDQSGQAIVSARGTMTPLDNPVTVHLSGSEIPLAQGTVDPKTALTGQASTSAAGTLMPSLDQTLVGSAMNSGQGGVAVGQDPDDTKIISGQGQLLIRQSDVSLIGAALTGVQGTVAITADAAFVLTGQASTSAAGTVVANNAHALIGTSVIGSQGHLGAPGGATLTGQAINGQQGTVYTTADRVYALTGTAITSTQGTIMAAVSLVPLAGLALTSATGSFSISGGAISQALTGRAISIGTGTIVSVGGDTIRGSGSNEGCSVTVGDANEGCGVTYAIAGEDRPVSFGWGNMEWGEPWGGHEVTTINAGTKEEVYG